MAIELLKYPDKIQHAEGKVAVALTDPRTGKITDLVQGPNHVYSELLTFTPIANSFNILAYISSLYTVLTDNTDAVDQNLPYVLGAVKGYGVPSQGSSGLLRGAYNAANQVLAQANGLTSVRWKFQYDFTPAQANGTIGRIGLTGQYLDDNAGAGLYPKKEVPGHTISGKRHLTNDGRYAYECSTAGIVTKYDIWLDTTSTIDISAIVETTSGTTKTVAYAPATGKFYIIAYNSTTTLRRVYVFSDNTFGTLETTYSPTALNISSAPCYVHGTTAFKVNDNGMTVFEFATNTATSITFAANFLGSTYYRWNYNTIGYDKYIISSSTDGNSSTGSWGGIFDMETKTVVSDINNAGPGNYNSPQYDCGCRLPFYDIVLAARRYASSPDYRFSTNPALAQKKLDTPVTKTSANGMTVTYELEVFW